eukprot:SAG31_NODE_33529_length_342_cov_3.539095_1_plen_28_part_01
MADDARSIRASAAPIKQDIEPPAPRGPA